MTKRFQPNPETGLTQDMCDQLNQGFALARLELSRRNAIRQVFYGEIGEDWRKPVPFIDRLLSFCHEWGQTRKDTEHEH